MLSEIKITNAAPGLTVLDIEGVIGVPEEWQFDEPSGRVATYRKFKETLAAISKIGPGEVIVNIRSTGGDVGDALLIHDALTGLDATITTRCYGYVASAATLVAQAASDGRREISSNSLYLVHNAVSNCEGNARDFRQREELLVKTDERIASLYAVRSGRAADGFAALMAENNGTGRWLSPEEALAAGLVDRITDAAPVSPEAAGISTAFSSASASKRKSLAGRVAALVDFLSGEKTTEKASPLPVCAADTDALRWQQDAELEHLRRRVIVLETRNRQMRALPTETKPKEDPSPADGRRSANDNAYTKDAEGFFN